MVAAALATAVAEHAIEIDVRIRGRLPGTRRPPSVATEQEFTA